MMPGDTALTRIPRDAYSMANDFVAADTPPLVSEASTDGTAELGCSTRVVVMLTMWPPPCSSIGAITRWVSVKKPVRFTPTTVA